MTTLPSPSPILHPFVDHSHRPLGRLEPRHDRRTLQLAKYLGVTKALPNPPAVVTWTGKTNGSWPMFLNDSIGDCTCASAAHMVEAWTAAGSKSEVEVKDSDALAMYQAVSGYNPNDPSTDTGAVELDVLRYWQKTGLAGHTIGAYASVGPGNKTLIKDAIWLFGGIYTGFALPLTAQTQEVWDVAPGSQASGEGQPGSWGGHAVPVLDYDSRGLTCVTWGQTKRMTWQFFRTYCEEAYACVSQDFFSGIKSASGFDIAALQADLAKLR